MTLTAGDIKKFSYELGADLCGIAPIERFVEAPEGFHPRDLLPECKSVIVLAKRFLHSTLNIGSTIPYSVVRNSLSARLDYMAVELSDKVEVKGFKALPVGTVGPCVWDDKTGKTRGLISLKHAAVQAGLGKIGKNTLLINNNYGNMLWLTGVLVSAELEGDAVAAYEGCIPNCRLCLDACPVKAMDGVSMNQQDCWNNTFEEMGGSQVLIKCFNCRKVCPNSLGIRS